MALFPHLETLRLRLVKFANLSSLTGLIAASGSPKGLLFEDIKVGFDIESESDRGDEDNSDPDSCPAPQSCPVDLSALEELVVRSSDYERGVNFLVHLVEESPPNGLKSLSLGDFCYLPESGNVPCSPLTMEKLVRLSAPSVVDLAINPRFATASGR
jgi:hypothetical protein